MRNIQSANRLAKLALINLLILATLGVILRYKIAFSLPFIHQKHLLHSHSHFAFAGWVGQLVMTGIFLTFRKHFSESQHRVFYQILILNSVFSYAQLLAFLLQGYGVYSIVFSSITTALSFYFGYLFWTKCTSAIPEISAWFFQAGFLFNVISSFGTGTLVYLMVNHLANMEWYLASVYFFLHFLYNGFFIFSILGLFFYLLDQHHVSLPGAKWLFWLFALSLPAAYLLSIIWGNLPWYGYIFAVIAAVVQFYAWVRILLFFCQNAAFQQALRPPAKLLIWISFLAATVKFTLQLLSVIPSVSQYAFGFRPIVIAYLHLVLLGFISLFLIAYVVQQGFIKLKQGFGLFLWIFLMGILGNELILMFQGLSFFGFWSPAHSNEWLLGMAISMFLGILGMNIYSTYEKKEGLT